jgi:hypothetical protein
MTEWLGWDLLLYKIFPLAFDTLHQGITLRLVCKRLAAAGLTRGFWNVWINRREIQLCKRFSGAGKQVLDIFREWASRRPLQVYLSHINYPSNTMINSWNIMQTEYLKVDMTASLRVDSQNRRIFYIDIYEVNNGVIVKQHERITYYI